MVITDQELVSHTCNRLNQRVTDQHAVKLSSISSTAWRTKKLNIITSTNEACFRQYSW